MNKYAYLDIETTGLHRKKDEITLIGVGFFEIKSPTTITVSEEQLCIEAPKCAEDIKQITDIVDDYKWCYHNASFDVSFIESKLGVRLPIDEDSMLIQHVLDSNKTKSLKKIAMQEYGFDDWDISLKDKTGKGDPDILKKYLMEGDIPIGIYVMIAKMLELKKADKRLHKVYRELMIRGARAITQMQVNGVYFDVVGAEKELIKFRQEVTQAKTKLLNSVPAKFKDINLNSSTQLALLFDELGFPIVVRTASGARSTSSDAVHELHKVVDHPVLDLLIEYRDKTRCVTFLEKWLELEYDGRIYPSFNLTGTKTGRLSSSDPNLQQVPRNQRLRGLFTAPKGNQFVECDFSQVELRIASHISGDPVMTDAYKRGEDLHTETARIFNEEPTKDDRTKAKAMNFGLLYGMQAKSYRDYAEKGYGVYMDLKEATKIRNDFFKKYKRLPMYHKRVEREVSQKGCIYTQFGRRRFFPNVFKNDSYLKSKDIRASINFPVQSMASDLLLSCIIEIHETDPTIKLVGTVHDSILVEVNNRSQLENLKRIMSSPKMLETFNIKLTIPLVADIEGGGGWGEVKWNFGQ